MALMHSSQAKRSDSEPIGCGYAYSSDRNASRSFLRAASQNSHSTMLPGCSSPKNDEEISDEH